MKQLWMDWQTFAEEVGDAGQETGAVECPVYDRAKLGMTDRIDGPCIVEQMDSTTVIPPHVWFKVDRHGNLIIHTFD